MDEYLILVVYEDIGIALVGLGIITLIIALVTHARQGGEHDVAKSMLENAKRELGEVRSQKKSKTPSALTIESVEKPEQNQPADLTGINFVPFICQVKFGEKNMDGIARQLNETVSIFEARGYEFLRIDTIHVDIRPGCIMALFGKQIEYHPYEFLVFRKRTK